MIDGDFWMIKYVLRNAFFGNIDDETKKPMICVEVWNSFLHFVFTSGQFQNPREKYHWQYLPHTHTYIHSNTSPSAAMDYIRRFHQLLLFESNRPQFKDKTSVGKIGKFDRYFTTNDHNFENMHYLDFVLSRWYNVRGVWIFAGCSGWNELLCTHNECGVCIVSIVWLKQLRPGNNHSPGEAVMLFVLSCLTRLRVSSCIFEFFLQVVVFWNNRFSGLHTLRSYSHFIF